MAKRETLKDWTGKIIGFVDHESGGDKILRDFHGRILGRYVASMDVTRDFYGRQVGKGDILMTLLR